MGPDPACTPQQHTNERVQAHRITPPSQVACFCQAYTHAVFALARPWSWALLFASDRASKSGDQGKRTSLGKTLVAVHVESCDRSAFSLSIDRLFCSFHLFAFSFKARAASSQESSSISCGEPSGPAPDSSQQVDSTHRQGRARSTSNLLHSSSSTSAST